MRTITKKADVLSELDQCFKNFNQNDLTPFVQEINSRILSAKIRFPLLEVCAIIIYEKVPAESHFELCDQIGDLKTIGGNVLIGILLRNNLDVRFEKSFSEAAKHIAAGKEWFVTDIIGERVFGWALLNYTERAILGLQKFTDHISIWVTRSIGPGVHNAIKNKLPSDDVEKLFLILLSLGNARNKEVKSGIGWAAKTTAKFHPEIIKKYDLKIQDSDKVGQWFRTKIKIGLERNAYASSH